MSRGTYLLLAAPPTRCSWLAVAVIRAACMGFSPQDPIADALSCAASLVLALFSGTVVAQTTPWEQRVISL